MARIRHVGKDGETGFEFLICYFRIMALIEGETWYTVVRWSAWTFFDKDTQKYTLGYWTT